MHCTHTLCMSLKYFSAFCFGLELCVAITKLLHTVEEKKKERYMNETIRNCFCITNYETTTKTKKTKNEEPGSPEYVSKTFAERTDLKKIRKYVRVCRLFSSRLLKLTENNTINMIWCKPNLL